MQNIYYSETGPHVSDYLIQQEFCAKFVHIISYKCKQHPEHDCRVLNYQISNEPQNCSKRNLNTI